MLGSVKRYFWRLGAAGVVVAGAVVCAAAEPKDISSFEELSLIGVDESYPLGGEYRLVDDIIDTSGGRSLNGGAGFLPIGARRVTRPGAGFGDPDVIDSTKAFTGTFDGGGHFIRGLYIKRTASDAAGSGSNIGLFGFALGATIRNVTVIADTVAGYRYVGALVGRQSGGLVENCVAMGAVVGKADVGGLVGLLENDGTVRLSYSSADVGGDDVNTVGGFAGLNDAAISESYSVGSVSVAEGEKVGGFAGSLTDRAKVISCYSTAAVSGGSAAAVGGLVGNVDDGGEVRQSYAAGAVSGGGAGGLIGTAGGTAARFSFWDKERSGRETSAGGNGAAGKTTAQMMNASEMNGLLVADAAAWGISNNYPYLKNKFFPRRELTVTATPGGTLSGVTSADGTSHTQRVNHWTVGNTVAAGAARLPVHPDSPDSTVVVESFDGWYLADSGKKLEAGRQSGFSVGKASAEGTDGELFVSDLTSDVAVEVEARFILKKYTLRYVAKNGYGSIASQDANLGTLNSAADTLVKLVYYGAVSSVTVAPNLGYKFASWNWRDDIGAPKKSYEPLRTDTVRSDSTFVANFSDSVTAVRLIYTAGDNGKLLLSGRAGTVNRVDTSVLSGKSGPTVSAIAVYPTDYRFVMWSDSVTDNPRRDLNVTDSIDVVAIFDTIPVSVKSPDRVVPALTRETAQIQPVKAIPAGLTAGPNPVSRQNGKVNLYWHGAEIAKGTLRVFDANGNFVSKIIINGINNNGINNYPIAAWTLTTAKGNPVGAGTYLIKGTLSTKNGKREKIALVLSLI